ncbi:hypothetical protein [Streptomyces sp. NPDC093225]|uniref:hypothetical protein n=1 Tax=Streptomyces sp. NPDC093225 TaxID=3366034 RepID=UPI003808F6B4
MRIDFRRTIRQGEYDGLQLTVLHADNGTLDTAGLAFADHGTFTERDTARGSAPGRDGYARIRDWHSNSHVPWRGADLTGLRQAVSAYATLWTPAPSSANPLSRQEGIQLPERETGLRDPEGFWGGDREFLDLLGQATRLVLDYAGFGTADGITLSENLRSARYSVRDTLGLSVEYGVLAEAEAAAHITQTVGIPYGPRTAEALARIDNLSTDDQHTVVKEASRRYATLRLEPKPPTPPRTSLPLPAPVRTLPASARSR